MKKRILSLLSVFVILFSLTACGKSENKKKNESTTSYEDLLQTFKEGYEEANIDKIASTMPDFMAKALKEEMTDDSLKLMISSYGNNFTVTFNVTGKTKMDNDWIEENLNYLKETYGNNINMSECYSIDGTMTLSGSLNTETNDIEELWYCNFNGIWKLVMG